VTTPWLAGLLLLKLIPTVVGPSTTVIGGDVILIRHWDMGALHALPRANWLSGALSCGQRVGEHSAKHNEVCANSPVKCPPLEVSVAVAPSSDSKTVLSFALPVPLASEEPAACFLGTKYYYHTSHGVTVSGSTWPVGKVLLPYKSRCHGVRVNMARGCAFSSRHKAFKWQI
jgi:hypothetical protein